MRKSTLLTFILCLLLSLALKAQSYTISTFAGNGTYGYTGDGGPATAAEIEGNDGLAVDKAGNVYISDYYANCIRKVDTSGIITTIAGNGTGGFTGDGGPASAAELNNPIGLAFDTAGNLFIVDAGNFRIRKVNSLGIISTIAGNGISGNSGDGGPATAAEFFSPEGIAVDLKGLIYVADISDFKVRKIDTSGIISNFAGTGIPAFSADGGQADSTALNYPVDVAADAYGNVFISDCHSSRIRKVNTLGIISTLANFPNYTGGICLDKKGNMYITDFDNQVSEINSGDTTIAIIAGTGVAGYSGDGGPATAAELHEPSALAIDTTGNVYVADYRNLVVRKLSPGPSSIVDIAANNLHASLFPNPSVQNIYLSFSDFNESPVIVELADITGRVVLRKNYKGSDSKDLPIYIGDLPPGVYFANILSGQKHLQTLKFVKE